MSKIVNIRLGGPVIEVSKDGVIPLEEMELFDVTQKLRFEQLNFKFGYNAYKGGKYSPKDTQSVILHGQDACGRLICNKGWFDWLYNYFVNKGYVINVNYEYPPLVRPDCYTENWERLLDTFEFRPHQEECITQIAERVRQRLGGIIDAVPAFGKTALLAMLCVVYDKAKIDIITTGNELIEDIYKAVIKHDPHVGQHGGGRHVDDRVTIYSSSSLHYSNYDADIVLADEVHLLLTEKRRAYLAQYDHAAMFGFSATPTHRLDNSSKCAEALFGPTIFKIGWQEATDSELVVPITVYWQDVICEDNPVEGVEDLLLRKRRGYWRNEVRNQKIADIARELFEQELQVLILVDTVEHALNIKKLLPEFEVCYSECGNNSNMKKFEKRGLLDGIPVMTKKRRKELKAGFESRELMGVIANSVWATGVSFNALEVLVRADGGSSSIGNIQLPGRVARIHDNKQCGILIDFLDAFDTATGVRATKRKRDYKKAGWKQIMPDGSVYG
ncbi:MAG: DEAD/DEAH box helicase family protein [Candidatus Bathyarchaeia archaeon]